jgi:multidrug efflux pump subunit AcrA (membrane-fusion protein)
MDTDALNDYSRKKQFRIGALCSLWNDEVKRQLKRFAFEFIAVLTVILIDLPVRAQTVEISSVVVTPAEQAEVPAQVLGILVDFSATRGDTVHEGQVLAQLDDTDVMLRQEKAQFELEISKQLAADNLAIELARKQYNFSTAEYQRLMVADKAQPRSVSTSEIERARLEAEQSEIALKRAQREKELATLKQAVASNMLKQAQRDVQLRKIVSPLNGKIESVSRNIGEWVKPGDPMFHIVGTSMVRAEGFATVSNLGLSVAELNELKNADVRLVVNIDGKPSKRHVGKVIFVSRLIDPVNGQLRVGAEFENSKGTLTPGLRGKMTLLLPKPSANRNNK